MQNDTQGAAAPRGADVVHPEPTPEGPSTRAGFSQLFEGIAALYSDAMAIVTDARHPDDMEEPAERKARLEEQALDLLSRIYFVEQQALALRSRVPR